MLRPNLHWLRWCSGLPAPEAPKGSFGGLANSEEGVCRELIDSAANQDYCGGAACEGR